MADQEKLTEIVSEWTHLSLSLPPLLQKGELTDVSQVINAKGSLTNQTCTMFLNSF